MRSQDEQATHHGDVLVEEQLLHESLFGGHGPIGMKEYSGEQRESREHECGGPGKQTRDEGSATSQFDHDGQDNTERGQWQADRFDVPDRACKTRDLGQAGRQEQSG